MAERIISSRVIDTKVINSGGILGGIFGGVGNKMNDIGAAIGGLCVAPIVFILAFAGLVYGENLAKNSEIVISLPLESATEVVGQDGVKKIEGDLVVLDAVMAPQVGEVAYYDYKIEEYEEVEKKQTRKEKDIVDGKEVEKTIEETVLVEEWVEKESDSKWGEVTVGPIEIDPERASIQINFEEKRYLESNDIFEEGVYQEITADNISAELGDRRLTVKYLPVEQKMIVVGELSQDKIVSGDTFIVTNKTDAQLISDLENSENIQYWVVKVITFILFMAAIMMLVRPVLEIVEMIPIAGTAASMAATVIAGVIAFFIVLIGSLIVKFWWLFLILSILILIAGGFIIFKYLTNKDKSK
jgi:hypothetical protein